MKTIILMCRVGGGRGMNGAFKGGNEGRQCVFIQVPFVPLYPFLVMVVSFNFIFLTTLFYFPFVI